MMMQALATRDALRICKANTHRPDLFIHENGAWEISSEAPSHNTPVKKMSGKENTVKTNRYFPTEDALQVVKANVPRPDLFVHENGAVPHEDIDFEIIESPKTSSYCRQS